MEWPLAKAKGEFSFLIAKAASEGVQLVTKRGTPVAFVLSPKDYKELIGAGSFKDFLRSGRLDEVSLERSSEPSRDFNL